MKHRGALLYRWLCLATLWMSACAPEPAARVRVALQIEVDSSGGHDWASGLVSRLRASPLPLAPAGGACGKPEVSHELRIGRQYTATSVITGVVLRGCGDGVREVQNFVQPRAADQNPDRAVVAWVAQRLGPPAARP